MAINWNRRKYTEEQFVEAVRSSTTYREILRKLGANPNAGGVYHTVKSTISQMNLDTSHFVGQGWAKGTKQPNTGFKKTPTEEILVENSTYLNTSNLKARLLKEGLLEKVCSGCRQVKWLNPFTEEIVDIPLALDHINGDRFDNRIDNLRLLCYNCHGLTDTFCGKNKKS